MRPRGVHTSRTIEAIQAAWRRRPELKHYLQFFDNCLWLAIVVLQWWLVLWAMRKRIFLHARMFTIFLAFVATQATALFAISRLPYAVYFWGYYVGATVEVILLVLVVYEVFLKVFAPLESLPPRAVARLLTTIIASLIIVTTLAVWRPATRPDVIAAFARTLDRTANLVVAVSFWSVVLYARSLGIPWRSRIAGIAKGFLLYLSVQSAIVAIMGFTQQTWWAPLNRIAMVSYTAALLIWTHALRRQEEEIQLPTPAALLKLRTAVAQMRRKTQTLVVQGKTRWIEE
jgi:hypothetical protein